jgi:hypothetical protein
LPLIRSDEACVFGRLLIHAVVGYPAENSEDSS